MILWCELKDIKRTKTVMFVCVNEGNMKRKSYRAERERQARAEKMIW